MVESMAVTYKAEAYRDETGAWCGAVEALHAYTGATSFRQLRANLSEAVEVSLDDLSETVNIELYVRVDDLAEAAAELGHAS